MARDQSKKIHEARSNWVKEYQHSFDLIISNSLILENLRRTIKPLKQYYNFLSYLDMSRRAATRLTMIGKREIMGDDSFHILSRNSKYLPDSIGTLEILLRLKDKKLEQHIKNNKIKKTMTRKDAHILVGGLSEDKEAKTKLKDRLVGMSKFADLRILADYQDEKKLMALLKDLKSLKDKYKFIDYEDKGYVDRVKKKLRQKEKIAKMNKVTKKDMKEAKDKLKDITKSTRSRLKVDTRFKGFKV